jgi:hypothetical protein
MRKPRERTTRAKARVQIPLVIFLLAMFFSIGLVNGQQDETTKVKFYIQIYDIDLTTDTAQVNVTITFSNLNTTGLMPTEPIWAVISDGIDTVQVNCTGDIYGDYAGSSGIMSWDLGGELGKGQYFPFEKYELGFQLANVLPLLPNMSQIKTGEDSYAYFEGAKKVILSETFRSTPTNVGPMIELSFTQNSLNATVYLSRNENNSILWLLIAPTIACSFVLASTILIYKWRDISNRLLVYISLLVFSPAFLISIQGYLPFRTGLSIPEVLAENLIISTAIFSALSLFHAKTIFEALIRDTCILFISFFSCSYILNLFEPKFPNAALPVFILSIIPYFLAIFGILTYRNGRFLRARIKHLARGNLWHYCVGLFGIILMETGLFYAAFDYGGYFASFEYSLTIAGMVSVTVGTLGIILFGWSLGLPRVRTRQFDGVV